MKIHLGVIDVPYTAESVTTGDVAGFLETKYGVMQRFWDKHAQSNTDDIANGLAGAIEGMMMGAPPGDPYADGMESIGQRFRVFLRDEEIVGTGAPGVPTQAALDGVNHRLKRRKGRRRPSFIDTGLYFATFKAWTTEPLAATPEPSKKEAKKIAKIQEQLS